MIHLTVATPLGMDSPFFSFIERLAVQNVHVCVDPPADHLDGEKPGNWIKAMASSSQHHFVIGYRYPPHYWPYLVEHATTVAVLADGDGMARQVDSIYMQEQEKGEGKQFDECLRGIWHAIDSMVGITDWLLSHGSPMRLIIPVESFYLDASEAFRRIEIFYHKANVPLPTSCWHEFALEVQSLIAQAKIRPQSTRSRIHNILTTELARPSQFRALNILLGEILPM